MCVFACACVYVCACGCVIEKETARERGREKTLLDSRRAREREKELAVNLFSCLGRFIRTPTRVRSVGGAAVCPFTQTVLLCLYGNVFKRKPKRRRSTVWLQRPLMGRLVKEAQIRAE